MVKVLPMASIKRQAYSKVVPVVTYLLPTICARIYQNCKTTYTTYIGNESRLKINLSSYHMTNKKFILAINVSNIGLGNILGNVLSQQ